MGFWETLDDWLARFGLGGSERKGVRPSKWLLLILGLVGVALLVAGSLPSAPPRSPVGNSQAPQVQMTASPEGVVEVLAYQRAYEEQLASLLSQIEGAGEVTVRVYLEAGPTHEYAQRVQKTTKTTQEQDRAGGSRLTSETTEQTEVVTVQDDGSRQERPVVITRREPTIRGVVVVADGAADPWIRMRLTQAVEAALAVPAHRVMVFTRSVR